jgi:hypothetical protein
MPDPLLTLIRKESERGRDPNSTYASNIEKIRLTNMLESLHTESKAMEENIIARMSSTELDKHQ